MKNNLEMRSKRATRVLTSNILNENIVKSKRSTRVLTSNILNENIVKSKRSTRVLTSNILNENIVKSKRSQVTIFIILAILIVAGVGAYFLLRNKILPTTINQELSPVYKYFQACVGDFTNDGTQLMGTQAGYIYLPKFEPGSDYAPFSSQLDFLGFPVPYWYYVSGNSVIKEQVPSKQEMQRQLAEYIKMKLQYCDFSLFEKQGFTIEKDLDNAAVNVNIEAKKINVKVDMQLTITKGKITATLKNHNVDVANKLGKLYSLALEIYNKEKKEMFLENYAVDVLRLYAPVDGVELSCSPLIWSSKQIFMELQSALEANMQAVKIKGDYYTLNKEENKYFVSELGKEKIDEAVDFLYFSDWPTSMEVTPTENELMIANPVGNQEGLGVLGFCYIPYHFIYDLKFPVLVQIYDENDPDKLFQFPVAIIIEKNNPRNALEGTAVEEEEPELCNYKNTEIAVYTYDNELQPVEADISFLCFDTECKIGKTKTSKDNKDSFLAGKFPQCINGFIIASAKDYSTKKYMISTNKPAVANILMDKLYEIDLNLLVDSKKFNGNAVIHFTGKENSFSLMYPEQTKVKLSENYYNVSVYVYRNSSLTIPRATTRQCVETSAGGLLDLFRKREECFEVEMPEQIISNALSAGGKTSEYITESQLKNSKVLEINVPSLPVPNSLDQLQDNYNLFEAKKIDINFNEKSQ